MLRTLLVLIECLEWFMSNFTLVLSIFWKLFLYSFSFLQFICPVWRWYFECLYSIHSSKKASFLPLLALYWWFSMLVCARQLDFVDLIRRWKRRFAPRMRAAKFCCDFEHAWTMEYPACYCVIEIQKMKSIALWSLMSWGWVKDRSFPTSLGFHLYRGMMDVVHVSW